MSTVTIQLPDSLTKSIEALAAKEGYTVSQFLASAAGEKLAAVMTANYLRHTRLCLLGLPCMAEIKRRKPDVERILIVTCPLCPM